MADDFADDLIASQQADLLADLLGDSATPTTVSESGSNESKKPYIAVTPFELVAPSWDLLGLTRSFHSVMREVEECSRNADNWVDQTQDFIDTLIDRLPEKWPEHNSRKITGDLLGQFYAISQQYPVSQYLDLFKSIEMCPDAFPVTLETEIPKTLLDQKIKIPFKAKINEFFSKIGQKKVANPVATVRLRWIGMYWLQYQHNIQLQGTTTDAGDLYFVFLKSIQRFFYMTAHTDMVNLKEEMSNEVHQLCDNLKNAHRSHLLYIYNGFKAEMKSAFNTWQNIKQINISPLEKKIVILQKSNAKALSKYSRALEYALEDFHIRLQMMQMQKQAVRIVEGELSIIRQQHKRLKQKLNEAIVNIEEVTPNNLSKLKDLSEHRFALVMEKAENGFYSTSSQLKIICKQIINNTRTNKTSKIILERLDKLSQALPEYANIVHLDRLWSWTNKKIILDESVPLRYTVEQYFRTNLEEELKKIHNRWTNYIQTWTTHIDQQDQFFRFSFYSLRQEWGDTHQGWYNANRTHIYKALQDSSKPAITQLQTIQNELNTEYNTLITKINSHSNKVIDEVENIIFDPNLRQRLLRIASEGDGYIATILSVMLRLRQNNVLINLPLVRNLIAFSDLCSDYYQKIKIRMNKKVLLKAESSVPAYYSRVFVIEPLEIQTLFVGRTTILKKLRNVWLQKEKGGRAVVAIVGIVGIGKRSLIEHFVHHEVKRSTIKIQLNLMNDNIVATINNKLFSLEKMLNKVQVDRFEIVVLEGLESCFIEKAGGAKLLQEFFNWLQKATHKIMWILSINQHAWSTIELLDEVGGTFTHVLRVHPLSKLHLKELLIKRHNVVGLNMEYKVPQTWFYKMLNSFNRQKCQKLLEWQFFTNLDQICQGNPAIALNVWLNYSRIIEENKILMLPINSDIELPHLEDDELLVLRIILIQGPIGPSHLQSAVISSKYLRVCLDHLKQFGLIVIRKHVDSTVFEINKMSYLKVINVLKQAMLIDYTIKIDDI